MTEKQENQVQTAVRIPESWLERLDGLADRLSQPGMRVTRAEALRLAAHRGLVAYETEGKKK